MRGSVGNSGKFRRGYEFVSPVGVPGKTACQGRFFVNGGGHSLNRLVRRQQEVDGDCTYSFAYIFVNDKVNFTAPDLAWSNN